MSSLLSANETFVLVLQLLFWIAIVFSSLPLMARVYFYWLGVSLASEFEQECRRRSRIACANSRQ
jgi:hypothetical protein